MEKKILQHLTITLRSFKQVRLLKDSFKIKILLLELKVEASVPLYKVILYINIISPQDHKDLNLFHLNHNNFFSSLKLPGRLTKIKITNNKLDLVLLLINHHKLHNN